MLDNTFIEIFHYRFLNAKIWFSDRNPDWSPEKTHSEVASMGSYLEGGEKSLFINRQLESASSLDLSDSFHSQIENKSTRAYRHKLYKRLEEYEYKDMLERWKNEAKMKEELKANKFIIKNSKTKIEIQEIKTNKILSKKSFQAKQELWLKKQEKKQAWKESRKLWKRVRES